MSKTGAIAAAAADEHGLRRLSKRRSPFSFLSGYTLRRASIFLVTFVVVLLLQIEVFRGPSTFASPSSPGDVVRQWEQVLGAVTAHGRDCARKLNSATSRLRDTVTFLPLKDLRLSDDPMGGTTWFMSSLNDTYELEEPQYLRFPSAASQGRLLCIAGNHTRDGTKNSYALAWPDALPRGASLLPGLTFVSDTYYDHQNLWHGLGAMMPFFAWHKNRGCVLPARWVLYHQGELRTAMGKWVRTLTEVALGQEVRIEDFAAEAGRPACFEEAVVFRHNEGVMTTRKKVQVYDMLRCKARAFCNVTSEAEEDGSRKGAPLIRMTLLLRTGARSFKNDSAVINIFRTVCTKFDGCRFTVAWANKLETFCDQVRTLSATDVVVSPHGAQLTNMFFMDRNSSIMEFIPKGWLKLAGPGQHVYQWLARNSGMRHQGTWNDPNGVHCPFLEEYQLCFPHYFKSQQLGHDEAYFANWTSAVLSQVKQHKLRESSVDTGSGQPRPRQPTGCACGWQTRL